VQYFSFTVISLGVRVKILEDLVKDRDSRIAALEMAIKIAELKLATSNSSAEDEQRGEIIHLKGFGKSIPQSDVNDKAANAVIEYVVSCNPRMIVWDGDSYSTSSFTKLIPPLRGRLPKCEFVAFLREEDQKRFYSSWDNIMDKSVYRYVNKKKEKQKRVFLLKNHSTYTLSNTHNTCVENLCRVDLQPNSCDWTQLGSAAFLATGGTKAVCYGGGPVVKDEYAAALERHATNLKSGENSSPISPTIFHW